VIRYFDGLQPFAGAPDVVNHVDDATFAKMKEIGLTSRATRARRDHEIAIPSLFLIDRTGVVRWALSDPDFKVRPSTAQIWVAATVG
jgi:hypothetical protein